MIGGGFIPGKDFLTVEMLSSADIFAGGGVADFSEVFDSTYVADFCTASTFLVEFETAVSLVLSAIAPFFSSPL